MPPYSVGPYIMLLAVCQFRCNLGEKACKAGA
jgi:hypothetical protein